MSEPPDQTPSAKPSDPSRLRGTGCGIAIGSTLGIVLVLAVWIYAARDPLPALMPADLAAARRLWEEKGPTSYNLEFTTIVRGQSGSYVVEVRGGQVVRMTRNGTAVADRGQAWDYRSIPGLFLTVDQDIELAADPETNFGVSDASGIMLQVEFDKKFGYPRRYRRIVPGTDRQIQWTVTRFVVVE